MSTTTIELTGAVNDDTVKLDEHIRKLVIDHKISPNNVEASTTGPDPEGLKILPATARKRFEEFGVDISKGYPSRPDLKKIPVFVDEAYQVRNEDYPYIERGKNADPEKKSSLWCC